MTVLSRGARARRSGRRPGWLLLTALLVLAIGASSALVFTNRVELLKLAVILSLWAAVVAAFVSVIYRRQSDVDQAQVRDLKLVYDLQLDREISARREYELTVESQLRRELTSELGAQAADEVAALRTELAALRTSLEVLFGTDLDERPALETERIAVRGYSDWDHDGQSTPADWVSSNRVRSVRQDGMSSRPEESPIIDVPEVGVLPPEQVAVPARERDVPPASEDAPTPAYGQPLAPPRHSTTDVVAETYQAADGYQADQADTYHAEAYRGSHWRPDGAGWPADGRGPGDGGLPTEEREEVYEPDLETPPPPPPQPARRRSRRRPEPAGQDMQWQPVEVEGLWLPAGAPGSHWVAGPPDNWAEHAADISADNFAEVGADNFADSSADDSADMVGAASMASASATVNQPAPPAAPSEPRGRHSSPAESAVARRGETGTGRQYSETGRRARARHSTEADSSGTGAPAPPAADEMPAPPEAAARHRSLEESDDDAPPTGGQSVADLLARLQPKPTGGRRRRRAE